MKYSSKDFYINPEKYLISKKEKFQEHLNKCSKQYEELPEQMKQIMRGIFLWMN